MDLAAKFHGGHPNDLEDGTAQGQPAQTGVSDVEAQQLQVTQPGQAARHHPHQVTVAGVEP